MFSQTVKSEVIEASQQWIMAFNKGDIQTCAEKYLSRAVMDVKPLGRYQGREAIQQFWATFVQLTKASGLLYSNIDINVIDENSAKLTASWSMNVARGVINEEHWVKENGTWLLANDDFSVEEQF